MAAVGKKRWGEGGSAAHGCLEPHVVPGRLSDSGAHFCDATASLEMAEPPGAPLWGVSWDAEGAPALAGFQRDFGSTLLVMPFPS